MNEFAKLEAQEGMEPIEPGEVMIASLVVWQRKKDGFRRLCADYKVQVNDKIRRGLPIPIHGNLVSQTE